MARKSRRGAGGTLFAWANLFNVFASAAAGYIGAQNRAEMERIKAENLNLKNQIAAVNIGKAHNEVLLGDLSIEEKLLKIEKLRRELCISTGAKFTASNYEEPGNIREDERRRLK